MAISIINLEAGMPTVELARSRHNQGLQSARMRGMRWENRIQPECPFQKPQSGFNLPFTPFPPSIPF